MIEISNGKMAIINGGYRFERVVDEDCGCR